MIGAVINDDSPPESDEYYDYTTEVAGRELGSTSATAESETCRSSSGLALTALLALAGEPGSARG